MNKKMAIGDLGLFLYNLILLIVAKILFENQFLHPYNYLLNIVFAIILIGGALIFWWFSFRNTQNVSGTNIALPFVLFATAMVICLNKDFSCIGCNAVNTMAAVAMLFYQVIWYFKTLLCYREVHGQLPEFLDMIKYFRNLDLNSAPVFFFVVSSILLVIIAFTK